MLVSSAAPDVSLASLTTTGVGGPAARLETATSDGELVEYVREADAAGIPVLVVGGGSNLIVSDDGFAGLVVLVRSAGLTRDGERLIVAAGHGWDELVIEAVSRHLSGIECLSGIPGLVGATPMQNVGAYGQQVSDVISRVRAYDRQDGVVRDLSPADCHFGYRTSRFKREVGRWVITEVEFSLHHSEMSEPIRYGELQRALGRERGPLAEVREQVLDLRRNKGMVLDPHDPDTRSTGSFFTNPVLGADDFARLQGLFDDDVPAFRESDGRYKVPAAWLIERAGFTKGYARGRARLSTKHPLAVTNPGDASAAEVVALAREVHDGVRDRLGVTLVNEPVLIGLSL